MTRKVEFNTNRYTFSHGKAPRGYGVWWFEARGQEVSFSGKYAEAKKQAAKWAKENGFSEVKVLS